MEDEDKGGGADPTLMILRGIRAACRVNIHHGVALWFDEFDRHLLQNPQGICSTLLAEILDQPYPLDAEERRFVDSRRGALILMEGVRRHLEGDLDGAEERYRTSLEIQRSCGCDACEGEVIVVLDLLGKERCGAPRDVFVEKLLVGVTVSGDSGRLLERRLQRSALPDYGDVLRAALSLRLVGPIVWALGNATGPKRGLAAAALARFAELEEIETIVPSLEDSYWFVRWRSSEALSAYGKTCVQRLELCQLIENETDPEVRRTLARLLGEIGGPESNLQLIAVLGDPDPEVRHAAATSLGQTGDVYALRPLQEVHDGVVLGGHSVRSAAKQAFERICGRQGLPAFGSLGLVRLPYEGSPVTSGKVFLAKDRLAVYAQITGAIERAVLLIRLVGEEGRFCYERQGTFEELRAKSSKGNLDTENPAVEILGEEPHSNASETPRDDEFYLEISHSKDGWPLGHGEVLVELMEIETQVLLENKTLFFTAISSVAFAAPLLCLAMTGGHTPALTTSIVKSGNGGFYTCSRFSTAPLGSKVISEILDTGGETVAHQQTRLVKEGEHFVFFPWNPDGWHPGQYRTKVSTEGVEQSVAFEIVDHLEIVAGVLGRGFDPYGYPLDLVTEFSTDDELICCAALLSPVPTGARVVATWKYLSEPNEVIETTSVATKASGSQVLGISLHRPEGGWRPGSYEVQLKLYASGQERRSDGWLNCPFEVVPPALVAKAQPSPSPGKLLAEIPLHQES